MKQTLLKGMLVMGAAGALLASCSDDTSPYSSASGKLFPTVNLDTEVISAQPRKAAEAPQSRAEADEIGLEDLTLTLTPADGGEGFSCVGLSNFPTDQEFKVGKYKFEVSYGSLTQEGFGCPAFYGSTDIEVEENRTAEVAVNVELVNSMVSIVFGESLLNYATNISAELQTVGDRITFSDTETRAAYVQPGSALISVSLTKPNGKSGTVLVPTFTAKAKTHHTVNIDIEGGASEAALDVTFDSTVDAEDVTIDLSDDGLTNAPAPVLSAKGFTSDEPIEFIPGLNSGAKMSVDIVAQSSIASLIMTTESASLLEQGWPASIDLTKASAADQANLKKLGLEALGVYRNPDRLAVVDLSGVAEHIHYIENAVNDSKITLVATDRAGKQSEPCVLSFVAKDLVLSLVGVTESFEYANDPLELTLSFNGNDPQSQIRFEYQNERGTWSALTTQSISPEADETFKAIVLAPGIDYSAKIRACCIPLGKYSNVVTVKQVPFRLAAEERNIWTYSATIYLAGSSLTPAELSKIASEGSLTIIPEVSDVTVDGVNFVLKGLTAGTSYTAYFTHEDDQCNSFTFTTEATTQLENGDMESWSSKTLSSGSKKCENYDCIGWATLNPLTTSKLNSSTDYSALSSTLSTNDVHGGSLAALIRSVGYDVRSERSYPLVGGDIDPHEYSQGELFLGDYNEGAKYGIEFTSRPTSLSFWYKYTAAQNSSDNGCALIEVLDADGNVIASASADLAPVDTYTEKVLTLNYPQGARKAASLKVNFNSTNAGYTYLTSDFIPQISRTALGTTTLNGYYVGSQLYIDDVTLNY